jgi:hypothetical protein
MPEPRVSVFFYGSYMNLDVLREVDLIPGDCEVATLSGFDVSVRPRANLVVSDQHLVYGIVTTATHPELRRLYDHAKDVLGETYLPQAVLVQGTGGQWRPALCYIAPEMPARPATRDYVDRILKPAREFGFPRWYIARLESFAP